jgi:hypothetical protein
VLDFDTSVLCAKEQCPNLTVLRADDHVKCVPVTTAWRVLRFADTGHSLQLRSIAVSILNKQSPMSDQLERWTRGKQMMTVKIA